MFARIDDFLDKITMYRLVLYELMLLLGIAAVLGAFGILPYNPLSLALTTGMFIVFSYITNKVFSYVYKAPTNVESVYITSLILALITQPMQLPTVIVSLASLKGVVLTTIFIGWLSVWSMASKYIFSIKKKHLFNPVAIAAVIVAVFLGQSVTWWVGTAWMAPFVALFGLLIVRKMQRTDLVFSFFLSAAVTVGVYTILIGGNLLTIFQMLLFSSSFLFFGFVMLTEPLTTPPTKKLQILYGALVGFLFTPQVHIGSMYSTPELALVVGNIFSYIVSPKQKVVLRLKEKIQSGLDQIDFVFTSPERLQFTPGQYMEWTLPHPHADGRGNRRYFTLANSPTEPDVHLGVKFYPNGSSYKKALALFSGHHAIAAGALAGDFTLPKDKTKKLVFLAGGIGITPFRSMVKYVVDTKEKRDIALFYSNKVASEIMYHTVWNEAMFAGIQVILTLTDMGKIPQNWMGERGRISAEMIKKKVPDYMDRTFYLSGPHAMIEGFDQTLRSMGVHELHIKKDFFPGFA